MTSKPKFYFDNEKFFPEATCFFIVGKDLRYITGFMNSKISQWYFKFIAPEIGGNLRWKEYAVKKMLIPKLSLGKIETSLSQRINTNPSIKLINALEGIFYAHFGLSAIEIKTIEDTISK
ncbi:MAG: hypothetical protein OXC61_05640 [Flavobacteriaceae bacterium]|nr:hypothetical protein [Flavobacteriaceae bacterium]